MVNRKMETEGRNRLSSCVGAKLVSIGGYRLYKEGENETYYRAVRLEFDRAVSLDIVCEPFDVDTGDGIEEASSLNIVESHDELWAPAGEKITCVKIGSTLTGAYVVDDDELLSHNTLPTFGLGLTSAIVLETESDSIVFERSSYVEEFVNVRRGVNVSESEWPGPFREESGWRCQHARGIARTE